jgi:hypothetical protein
VTAAVQARDALGEAVATGQSLINRTLTVLREFDDTRRQRNQQHQDVRLKLPRHEQLLETMQRDYADSSLVLQAADPSHASSSATATSHLSRCHDLLRDAERAIETADVKYRDGLLLEAASMLDLADGALRESDNLLSEIDQHCTQLNAVSQENEGRLVGLGDTAKALRTRVNDRRTTRPTLDGYQRIVSEIDSATREIGKTLPRDPFQDAATIAGFATKLAGLDASIAADMDAHAEARRAVDGARNELRVGESLIDRSRSDGIPDSPATLQSVRAIQSLGTSLANVQQRLDGQHEDWEAVDREATQLHSSLSVETARLRGELESAEQSAALLQAASTAVFEATRWTGGIGSRIFGSPGSAELEHARRALNEGNYAGMIELARTAQIAAQQAIQRAQREVERKQREAARRAEQARRQRRQSSISLGGSSGTSFGSSHRSSGSSSRSSSSSGNRSSGSGFSRSGW